MNGMTVSRLQPGDEFEASGSSYRLIYNVGDSRSYVQLLNTKHVVVKGADGETKKEFDRPGDKTSISTGTVITRLIRRAGDIDD